MGVNASIQDPTRSEPYRSFEDLEVYKTARNFRKAMYQVAKNLPEFEKFGLVSQIRRAAVSLTNNLAEGHGRFHFLDQIKFTLISRGSLEELLDDLNICSDENYLPPRQVEELKTAGWQVLKLTNGYLRYLRDRKSGASLELREASPNYGATESEESLAWLDELLEKHPELKPASEVRY
ncbi:MAG TPA: four helix bundle protein [Verrucomicrobiae bacterium]|jgi:four helix bundle protein|nr:four helix bundle protein [Verrucomicrobiae bacterium]